jgi:ParB-like chromosome segregation protein Spo0J
VATPEFDFENTADITSDEKVAELVPIERIHEWPQNPDPPEPKDVRTIARSIRRFGWGEPILARLENGEIIAGHGRYRAAKRLKLKAVPVRYMNLSEDEAHLLALADNKIAANRQRDWDGEDVANILDELEEKGFDLEKGTGFSDDELDDILGDPDDESSGESELDSTLKLQLVVDCRDEHEQAALMIRLEKEGYTVKPVMT